MLYQLSYEPAHRALVSELTRFLVLRMPAAKTTVFLMNNPIAVLLLVLRRRIVSAFALRARQNDKVSHGFFRVSLEGIALLPLCEQSS